MNHFNLKNLFLYKSLKNVGLWFTGKTWESDEMKEERVDLSMTNTLSKQKAIHVDKEESLLDVYIERERD